MVRRIQLVIFAILTKVDLSPRRLRSRKQDRRLARHLVPPDRNFDLSTSALERRSVSRRFPEQFFPSIGS